MGSMLAMHTLPHICDSQERSHKVSKLCEQVPMDFSAQPYKRRGIIRSELVKLGENKMVRNNIRLVVGSLDSIFEFGLQEVHLLVANKREPILI